jgi:hypothetical protein
MIEMVLLILMIATALEHIPPVENIDSPSIQTSVGYGWTFSFKPIATWQLPPNALLAMRLCNGSTIALYSSMLFREYTTKFAAKIGIGSITYPS